MAKKDAETMTKGLTGFILLAIGIWFYFKYIRAPAPDASAMPAAESALISAVSQARDAWNKAPNDIAQLPIRAARAQAICAAVPDFQASNWIGIVKSIDDSTFADRNGKLVASVEITIGPNINVSATDSELSDPTSALIEAGSPMYQMLATLPIGSNVSFSGQFVPNKQDCIQETSLTDDGSMTDPEFKIALMSLAKS